MDDAAPLASLSLTHVYYDPADPISYLCAFLALVPQALCIVYATLIWSTREAEVALMFAGQLGCEVVNFGLKRLIKEERPPRIQVTGKGYGMPSSHAQFVFFWAVAVSLFLLVRHRPKIAPNTSNSGTAGQGEKTGGNSKTGGGAAGQNASLDALRARAAIHQPLSILDRALVSAAALTIATLVAWSRIYLGYHTPKQVLAGCLAGAVTAFAWFAATYVLRVTGWLAWGLTQPPARWIRMRDLAIEEDMAQAGWEKWEERRLASIAAKSK